MEDFKPFQFGKASDKKEEDKTAVVVTDLTVLVIKFENFSILCLLLLSIYIFPSLYKST